MPRLLLLFLLFGLACGARAAESLTWLLLPIPGAINLKQGVPDDGMALELLRALEPGLAQVWPTPAAADVTPPLPLHWWKAATRATPAPPRPGRGWPTCSKPARRANSGPR